MMRICHSRGILHPDHLQSVCTPRQLDDLLAFFEIEPWGGPADDYRAALITWANVLGKTGRRSYSVEHFLPKWGPRDPLTPAEYKEKARVAHARAAPLPN